MNPYVEITQGTGLVIMVIAFAAFSFVTMSFKAVYLNYRHTIWEDIYGRGVAFFLCSTFHYMMSSGVHSIFDLRKTIRTQFMLRVVLISAAYVFLFLAIEWGSSFLYIALIVCVLPPVCRIIQRSALIEQRYSTWESLVIAGAIVGLVFLFRSESHFVNKN